MLFFQACNIAFQGKRMSLAQSLRPIEIDQNAIAAEARSVAIEIRRRCAPKRVILFGSAATGSFKFGSDLDFILVFRDLSELRTARSKLRKDGKLHNEFPIDLIFMTQEHFDTEKERGGLCYIVESEGVDL